MDVSDYFDPHWLIVGIVGVFVLAAFGLNYRRARKWERKARSHGDVHCRTCGFVGELEVRTTSINENSSSNLVLVCPQCNGSDWFVPESEKSA